MLFYSLIHGIIQTRELEAEMVPQRTMSNAYCFRVILILLHISTFTDLAFNTLVDVMCIDHT